MKKYIIILTQVLFSSVMSYHILLPGRRNERCELKMGMHVVASWQPTIKEQVARTDETRELAVGRTPHSTPSPSQASCCCG